MSEKFGHFTTEMQKYQITESELSQALNHDIKTVDQRSGWLVFNYRGCQWPYYRISWLSRHRFNSKRG